MFHCLLALNVSREISKDSPHFPFSVCSLYFDACRIISFSLKSSTYISIRINVHEFSSSSKKDTVCPINVKNWALSENLLKWYVQIFFLLIYSVFFSKDTKNMLSHHCLSCPSCTIQSFFFHSSVCFLFILLIFSSLHSMSLYFYQCLFSFVHIQGSFYYYIHFTFLI